MDSVRFRHRVCILVRRKSASLMSKVYHVRSFTWNFLSLGSSLDCTSKMSFPSSVRIENLVHRLENYSDGMECGGRQGATAHQEHFTRIGHPNFSN